MLLSMGQRGTAQRLERRPRQAIRLLKAGQSRPGIARALSGSVSSVFRRYQTYRRKGVRGLTHPNSARPSLSGTRRIERWRTERPWTWPRCNGASGVKRADPEARRSSFGPVSMPPTCRDHEASISITYANLDKSTKKARPDARRP